MNSCYLSMPTRFLLPLLLSFFIGFKPAYADCQAPGYTNTYNITHQSASLSWSYYGSGSPTYQMHWRAVGTTNWTTGPVLTNTITSLTGLTNNTGYEWQVRSICAAGDTSLYTSTATFQTQCIQPYYTSVTNVTHQSALLTWGLVASAASYEVQWRPAGSSTWTTVGGLTSGSLNLTGLPDETSFEWRVRTVCSVTATSDFVNGSLFRTRCLPPSNARTTLVNPNAAELKWDSPVNNGLFDLQWRPAGSSTWTLVEGIASAEYILAGLTNNTSYEWQVRTACSATSKSLFTAIQVFQTNCQLPTNLGVSSVSHNLATLTWSALASDLQWRKTGTTDWTTVLAARPPYSLTGLTNNTTYEWRVRAVCSEGAVSDYTPSQLLITQCATPAYLSSYSNTASGADLYWSSSVGGPFEMQWRAAGTGSWSAVSGISSSSYSLSGLAAATVYEWRVRKVCSATDFSDFTATQLFQTYCSAPANLNYTQSGNGTVNVFWTAAESGARYELQWRVTNTTTWSTVSGITSTAYDLTNLQLNNSYEWRVRKLCSDQLTSSYTNGPAFTISCGQLTSFYVNDVGISSARVSWYGPTTYPPYELQYRQTGAASWTTISGLTISVYSFSGLSPNVVYEWRVHSTCPAGGANDFSPIQNFRTQCGPPLANLAVTAVDIDAVKLTWVYANSRQLYEIQYRAVNGGDWTVLRPDGTETDPNFGGSDGSYYQKQYTIYGLTTGTTYEWRVRVFCTPSIYSDFQYGPTFMPGCTAPKNLYSYQQTNTSISVSWDSPTLASSFDLQWRVAGTTAWSTVNGLTNNGYVLTDLTAGTMYELRVRQLCSSGFASDFSGIIAAQLQCITPSSLTTEILSGTSVRLNWSYYNLNGNDGIVLPHDLQYRISGTSTWTTVSGIIGTTYSLTGLTAGSSYEWQVRASCSSGVNSGFSYSTGFALSCSTPYGSNTQIGPTSALLSWSNIGSSSQSYVLRWRLVGSATWTMVSISATTYSLTGLTNGASYEWQVATDCGGGALSSFSSLLTFKADCPSVVGTYTIRVTSAGAQLGWSGYNLSPPAIYTIQYRISGTVIWSEINNVSGTSLFLSGLLAKTTYEWRVRAICESSVSSVFSPSSTFTTNCTPVTTLSTSDVTAQSASISWVPGSDYTGVNLQWRVRYADNPWNDVKGLTGTVYSLTGLTPSTSYEYQVQGVCSANDLSSFSNNSFITESVDGMNRFYVNTDSLTSQAARLSWTNGPNRTNYILQWRVSGGSWNSTGPLSSKKYLLTGLTPNTSYNIRVSYVGDNLLTYESTTTFTTPCPRVANTYTNLIRPTSAVLSWTSANLPVALQWRMAGTTTWNSVTGLSGNTYSLTGLANNTLYEWRIQTYCSASVTNLTYPVTFRTLCQMPISINTVNIMATSAKLVWSGSAATFLVRYRVVGSPNWTTVTNLTTNSYNLTGLAVNTLYEWAVASYCELNSTTPYTNSIRFTTQCSLPPYVSVNATAPDRAQLSWDGMEPSYQLQWRAIGTISWNTVAEVTSPYTLTGLATGVTYEARLRSACAVAANGPFLSIYSFTPQCSYYSDYKSTDQITSSTARLTWTVNALMTYGLRWRVSGTDAWNTVPGVVTSPFTLTGLTNNASYEWQLRTECQPGYGSSQIFQTTCGVPGGLRAQPITATSVNLYWNSSGENVPYELQWRPAGASTWTTISGITSTSYTLTNLANYPNYEWQVRSQCSGGSGFQLTASFKLVDDCTFAIYTVRTGSWDDPTVWSCNRVPALTDQVQVNHVVTIPAGYAAKAAVVRYAVGAQLTFGVGATVQFGN